MGNKEEPIVCACLYNVEEERSYIGYHCITDGSLRVIDAEIRIEDNLTLSDADVVAVCILEIDGIFSID